MKEKIMYIILIGLFINSSSSDFLPNNRQGRQQGFAKNEYGGIDFSNAVLDAETGKRCVIKQDKVTSIKKEPILECTHKSIEKCHYTYVTQFSPAQEEVCTENFEKTCQITFKKQAKEETIKKCYKPMKKVCNGQGPEECRTVYESSCVTKYVEKKPGKYVGDTQCQKLPIQICGKGCITQEEPEECHDKKITSLLDIPEEVCDLNPQKTCTLQTKLVPRLKPKHECTIIPQQVCNLKFTSPELQEKPLMTKWCLDDSPTVPGEIYDESEAFAPPIRTGRTAVLEPLFTSNLSGSKINEAKFLTKVKKDVSLQSSFNYPTQQFSSFRDVSNIKMF